MKNSYSSLAVRKYRLWCLGVSLALCAVPLLAQEGSAPPSGAAPAETQSPETPPAAGPDAAAESAAIPSRLSDWFMAGGPLMWPILGCSFLTLAVTVERLVVLRKSRVIPRDFVLRFLENIAVGQLDRQTALQLCEDNASPVAEVFAHGVRKWGKPSVEVEQAIIDGGERQVGQLRKRLRILNAISTVSPLLGLLGTVFGMIDCFNRIATNSAMGKSEKLAEGIGMALITTAGGLCVAIPSLIMYMYFAGRVDELVIEMDALAQKLVNLISAEGISTQAATLSNRAPAKSKTMTSVEIKESPRTPARSG
jgi:biopolymer transport protein ExbB